jgi:hypothetical protein
MGVDLVFAETMPKALSSECSKVLEMFPKWLGTYLKGLGACPRGLGRHYQHSRLLRWQEQGQVFTVSVSSEQVS